MSGSRKLIVNADDFGRSPGINAGILQAHSQGIVTSTTLMVNLRWADAAVREAAVHPRLGVGLHFNLCYGRPVSDPTSVPSLVDGCGCLLTDTRRIANNADPGHVLVELRAQLDRFRALTGREPTHVDSHKYVHSARRLLPVVGREAAGRGLPVRATDDADRRTLQRLGVQTTDGFDGRFHGLDGGGVGLDLLVAVIEAAGTGATELMCHPGLVDEHIQDSSYRDDRERELEALCSPQAHDVIDRLGIGLVTFEALGRETPSGDETGSYD